jgi:hypothetical protein
MSQRIQVIDNFLPTAYQDALENVMLNANFPWYLNAKTALLRPTTVASSTTTDAPQFTHKFFTDWQPVSEYYNLVSLVTHHLMLTKNIDTSELIRIKGNLNTPINNYPKDHHYVAHVDCPDVTKYITAIYYVNDSDGDTKFFNSSGGITDKVTPKKGRLVYFDGDTTHAGCPPINTNVRCVINFNFKTKETK